MLSEVFAIGGIQVGTIEGKIFSDLVSKPEGDVHLGFPEEVIGGTERSGNRYRVEVSITEDGLPTVYLTIQALIAYIHIESGLFVGDKGKGRSNGQGVASL